MINLHRLCIIHVVATLLSTLLSLISVAISATCKDEKGKQEMETGQQPSGLSATLTKVKCAKRQKTVVRVRFYMLSMKNKACRKNLSKGYNQRPEGSKEESHMVVKEKRKGDH
uniref:Putative uncharacterized protein encoded by LINC00305 n=1 Tax=Homo sapiens TaxID=9606 RepID=CR020_HUMAN|nr:putative uncharacterized protein encoded by LINC00305 isoform X1 [Pan paniscus]Q7Z4B0.1 RecName: Full=Putative uncharacterized protein encoded by LINC00305; Flags: Precursor [Homo sapiens]AAQ16114.1 unknown [Homo sapiens]